MCFKTFFDSFHPAIKIARCHSLQCKSMTDVMVSLNIHNVITAQTHLIISSSDGAAPKNRA